MLRKIVGAAAAVGFAAWQWGASAFHVLDFAITAESMPSGVQHLNGVLTRWLGRPVTAGDLLAAGLLLACAAAFLPETRGLAARIRRREHSPRPKSSLEFVMRPGGGFQDRGGDFTRGAAGSVEIDYLIGVRNTSEVSISDVRVQVVSASQGVAGLPITLRARDASPDESWLAPGEMRLYSMLRLTLNPYGGHRHLLIGGKELGSGHGLVPSIACDLTVAAYERSGSSMVKLSLDYDQHGELEITPASLGDIPGGLDPALYGNLIFRLARLNPGSGNGTPSLSGIARRTRPRTPRG